MQKSEEIEEVSCTSWCANPQHRCVVSPPLCLRVDIIVTVLYLPQLCQQNERLEELNGQLSSKLESYADQAHELTLLNHEKTAIQEQVWFHMH